MVLTQPLAPLVLLDLFVISQLILTHVALHGIVVLRRRLTGVPTGSPVRALRLQTTVLLSFGHAAIVKP